MHEYLKLFGTNNQLKIDQFLIYERDLVLTTLVTSFILTAFVGITAPFMAVLAVGLVVGFVIGFLIDSLDSYYLNFTGGIKYLLNKIQDGFASNIKKIN